MTAPDVLEGLVEGETYQLATSPDGEGGVRWQLHRYQQPGPGTLRMSGTGGPMWCQIATGTTSTPPSGRYAGAARGWLRALGYDPGAMDLVLILPDGVERLRPGAAGAE